MALNLLVALYLEEILVNNEDRYALNAEIEARVNNCTVSIKLISGKRQEAFEVRLVMKST